MYQELRYEVEDPIATITFDRPDRLNAMTNRMTDELKHAVAQAEADERAVAIVLTGAGRGFCAGADLQGLKAIGEGRSYGEGANLEAKPGDASMGPNFSGPYAYLFSVRKPVIAAINGPCAGLGFAVMCFADLRFASDRAVFSTAFSRRGLIAEWGIGWTLPRLVGHSHALDLLFSARRFDAAEAERIGLVNRALPHDELLPFVPRVREGAGRQRVAHVDVGDQAPDLHAARGRARALARRVDPPDDRELRPARLSRRRELLPREAPAEVLSNQDLDSTISVISAGAKQAHRRAPEAGAAAHVELARAAPVEPRDPAARRGARA